MELNKYIDHTYLKPFAMESDIIRICDEAKKYHFASVCVNPCNVPLVAKELAGSDVAVCSVVGFPFGTHTTKTKLFETREALDNGAAVPKRLPPVPRTPHLPGSDVLH